MRTSNELTFRDPNIVASEACALSCSGLVSRANEAVLASLDDPNEQKIIVCEKAGRLLCGAKVLSEGRYGATFGELVDNGEDHFLANPGYYSGGVTGSVDQVVIRAHENGAEDYTFCEVRKLRTQS